MNKYRILHVVGSLNNGGIENNVLNYTRGFYKSNFVLDVLVYGNKSGALLQEYITYSNNLFSLNKRFFLMDLINFRNRCSFIDFNCYDFIHLHLDSRNIIFAKLLSKIYINGKFILHSHNSGIGKFKIFQFIINRLTLAYSNYHFACSHKSGLFFFGKKNYTLFPNAIDVNDYSFNVLNRNTMREKLNLTNKKVVLQVGSFTPNKNHTKTLMVMRELNLIDPNYHLLLVGSGKLEKDILEKIKALKLTDSTSILSSINNINGCLSVADILMLPSHSEGSPMVLLEACASGLPSLISNRIQLDYKSELIKAVGLNTEDSKWAELIIQIVNSQSGIDRFCQLPTRYHLSNAVEELKEFYNAN
jgi:glycosyltransferase involved in cell wall biosynthesis